MEPIPSVIHASWHEFLGPLFDDERMKKIKYGLLPNTRFLPQPRDIFNVFSTPTDEVKVVILGQDPYPKPGDAIGYAFATAIDRPIPKSLGVIRTEIEEEGFDIDVYDDKWRTLSHWTKQGVFLLNTALTVEEARAGSHLRAWKWFTEEVIKFISNKINPIWVLWGAKAQSFQSQINFDNYILTAPHPAVEFYPNKGKSFYGCNHFRMINEELIKRKLKPIKF